MKSATNPNVIEEYHRWYYDTGVWEKTSFLGIPCYKSVCDMWNYQEILFERKPSLVVEFGSWAGGSALFFSSILQLIRSDFRVLSVDVDHSRLIPGLLNHPSIEFLMSSSTDPCIARRILELRQEYPGPIFAILDSDHRKQHVLEEMRLLREVLLPGDYLVVEDSNINGHPVLPGWGEGPMEALLAYEQEFPNDFHHDSQREMKFGFSFAPYGFLIRR